MAGWGKGGPAPLLSFLHEPPLCGCPRSQTRAGLHARGPSAGYEQALPVCRRSDRPWPGPACGGLDGGTVGCKHHPIFCCCSHDPSVSPAWGLRGCPDPSARIFAHVPCHPAAEDRKSTRLNSSHLVISYAVFCLKKKNKKKRKQVYDTRVNKQSLQLCSRQHH